MSNPAIDAIPMKDAGQIDLVKVEELLTAKSAFWPAAKRLAVASVLRDLADQFDEPPTACPPPPQSHQQVFPRASWGRN